MRVFSLLPVVAAVVGCSGRAPEAGPTTAPERGVGSAGEVGAASTAPPRPLDAARLDALAAVQVADHEVSIARRSAQDLAVIVRRGGDGGAAVTITASACLACTPIALAAWDARHAELAALWAPAEAQGDRLELSAPTVAGRAVIAIDGRRTLDGEQRHTYQLHWNDGATQLAAVCEATAMIGDAGVAPPDDGCAAAARTALGPYLAALGG